VIQQAKHYIEERTALRPSMAVVLGSGLGAFADELTERTDLPYSDIPGWPVSTAIGHAGKLVIGRLDGMPLAVMAGRAHLY
jgi:purine-nucleoside phosphorylase